MKEERLRCPVNESTDQAAAAAQGGDDSLTVYMGGEWEHDPVGQHCEGSAGVDDTVSDGTKGQPHD